MRAQFTREFCGGIPSTLLLADVTGDGALDLVASSSTANGDHRVIAAGRPAVS